MDRNKNSVNNKLIEVLKKRTPQRGTTVNFLMEILHMGKEAAYRRLRGEILFTLDEAIVICKKLNISLDILVGTQQENMYPFHANTIFAESPMDEYIKMVDEIITAVKYVKDVPGSYSLRACNALPLDFISKYDILTKIYIRIVVYQLYLQKTPNGPVELDVPSDIMVRQGKLFEVMQDIDSVLILDKRIILDYVEIVNYLKELSVVTTEEVMEVKRDLHYLLDDLEKCASRGYSFHNKKLDIYLSHISFDCSYRYLSSTHMDACSIGIFWLDNLSSTNKKVCEKQKNWIKSLIRFSTLISVSGELERNEYFSRQRKLIDELL